MYLWSDDCLSCLCNFPHEAKQHYAALARAEQERQEFLREHRLFEEDAELEMFPDLNEWED